MKNWLKALRVNQWTKNFAVMLAWFFSVADASQKDISRGFGSFLMALGMSGAFCLVSSAFYLLNDVSDYDSDRLHPEKRWRPVAAGFISKIAAVKAALVLFACGVTFPSLVVMIYPHRTIAFGTIMLYSVLQCFYSGLLKHIPYVDVVVIASGFVLRAVAGAAVIDAYISRWLLICAFTLSLFLALSKRHHELLFHCDSRPALAGYRKGILNMLIFATAAASVAEYVCYTRFSSMGARFPALVWTSAFVIFGIGRYLMLVYREGGGGRPEKALLTDRILWIALFGYAVSAVVAVWCGTAG
jgi:4-hydroxybenzoate polyprenyltransferase